MENKERPSHIQEKPTLEYLQDYIQRAPARTEKEFTTTQNTWMACFLTNIVTIEMRMHMHDDELLKVLTEKYQTAKDKLKILKERSIRLGEKYPTREVSPPDNVKRELLNELNIFE